MKIQIASDLHIDRNGTWNDSQTFPISIPKNSNEIVLIIAGDLSPDVNDNLSILNFYSRFYKNVIFILGNHEYDFMDVDKVYQKYQRKLKKGSNIHILEKTSVIIDDIIFYGCTGWGNSLESNYIKEEIVDFKNIINFTPDKCFELFNESKKWIAGMFSSPFALELENKKMKRVLITHFAFCMQSLNFHNSLLNGYFVNEGLESLWFKPNVYIHGHTHQYTSYIFKEKTRVYCNAFGYHSGPRPVTKYKPELIIEV